MVAWYELELGLGRLFRCLLLNMDILIMIIIVEIMIMIRMLWLLRFIFTS